MIVSEIEKLEKYIARECKVTTQIGDKDLAPDQYPMVSIIPDNDFSIDLNQMSIGLVNFPVTIKITDARENELDALGILESILNNIRNFGKPKGDYFEGGGTTEYTDNTYEIKVNYNLKIIGV